MVIYIFYKLYVKRRVLFSLGLTVMLFFMIMVLFFTLSKTFNSWTVAVDLCKETIDYQ